MNLDATIARAVALASRWGELARDGDSRFRAIALDHGLSPEMTVWGAQRWAATFTRTALDHLALERPDDRPLKLGVILAGSVPSVAVEQTLLALAMGGEVWVKTPSDQRASLTGLQALLRAEAPELAAKLRTTASRDSVGGLLDWADAVEGYGSDATLAELGAAARTQGTHWIAYGHRISIALAAPDSPPAAWADAVAADVAAFDQQGCMSPQALYVAQGTAQAWGEALAVALDGYGQRLPRGPLSAGQHAQIAQARGVVAFLGRAWPTTDALVLHQPGLALRPSPGPRVLHVIEYADWHDVLALDAWRRVPLSSIGVAGGPPWIDHVAAATPHLQGTRIVPAGTMQFPPLYRRHDGHRRVGTWFEVTP